MPWHDQPSLGAASLLGHACFPLCTIPSEAPFVSLEALRLTEMSVWMSYPLFLKTQNHDLPYLHARYAESRASVGLDDGGVLAGKSPRKHLRLVQAWIELSSD